MLAVANALRGEVYAAEYRFPEGAGGRAAGAHRLAAGAPPRGLPRARHPRRARSRDGLAERLAEWQGGRHPRTVHGLATAGALLELAARRGGVAVVADPAGWEPEYGRPAEAQAKWEREHGHTLPDSPGQFR